MLTTLSRVNALLRDDPDSLARFRKLLAFSRTVRTGEYHITNACNIRCQGCWFFEHEFDQRSKDERDIAAWSAFARQQRDDHGVSNAMLIGGEPTLFLDRIKVWVDTVPYVIVSSNGLNKLPVEGFERVCLAVSLFGGGGLDDELRAIRPSGTRFTGLFDKALANYRDDPRVVFIYAISNQSLPYLEDTVKRIADNGNRVGLNYYSTNRGIDPLRRRESNQPLLDEALRVRASYPQVLGCDDIFIRALITGRAPWGDSFGYDVCPSVSVSHPRNAERLANGNPVLPGFNAWASDLKTLHMCCTSGQCDGCRDSQAVYSWLLVSFQHFLASKTELLAWLNMAECYWSGFIWSPYHPFRREPAAA